jgi:putative oxidoreductase
VVKPAEDASLSLLRVAELLHEAGPKREPIMNSLRYLDFGQSRPLLLLIARIAIVLLFIIFGLPKMTGFDGTVQYMAKLGAPMPMLAAIIAVVMEIPAAILIVLGFFTRPIALLFVFYTLGTAIIGHHYWDMSGDAVMPNMINFYKNISIAGAFLLLAVTGPGAISIDRR